MNVTTLFFSPSGRIPRWQFWFGAFCVFACVAAALGLYLATGNSQFGFPLILGGVIAGFLVAIKRLHDRNKSAWWVLLFLWAPGALDRLGNQLTDGSALWWLLALITAAISLWGLIELGFLRGTDGDNEYGPDPLSKAASPGDAPLNS